MCLRWYRAVSYVAYPKLIYYCHVADGIRLCVSLLSLRICSTNGIQYFGIIYKQFDAIIADEVRMRLETGQIPGASMLSHWTVLEGDKEPVDIRPFELYLVLQVRIYYAIYIELYIYYFPHCVPEFTACIVGGSVDG